MIDLAVFGAMVFAFAAGYLACHLVHMTPDKQQDACQPALEQLAELAVVREPKKEVRKPVMRRQWSEDIPAKEDQ